MANVRVYFATNRNLLPDNKLEMFGADAEFPELSRLLDPFVEDESEPEPEERSVIEAEAHRVLAEIQAITTTTRPALFADQRESLRRRLRSIPDSDRDELLDLEVLLAIAALTIPAAAIAAEAMASRDLTTDEVGRILDALAESKG